MHQVSKSGSSARITRLAVGLGLALIASLVALTSAASAAYGPNQWTLRFSGAATTNALFSLYNQDERQEVRYGSRSCGINLVWSPGVTREWRFHRASGTTGPLRYNEPLALFNTTTRKYIHYQSRSCGINLAWSSGRQLQWRLRGGTSGTLITSTSSLALHNDIENDSVVYGSRPFGINLMWFKDSQNAYYCIHYPSGPGC